MNPLAGVDLGKTGCRVVVQEAAAPRPPVERPGAPGLADPGGVDAAYSAVAGVLRRALPDPAALGALTAVAVGAAGAEAAPKASAELVGRLSRLLPHAGVALTSDSVTAHAGALGGEPGTVLAVGTGSVALGLAAGGALRQVDGWGPWLGDEGSGAWIGRAGLRSALRRLDGRGPATVLADAAGERFGDLRLLPQAVTAGGALARTFASFAPEVLDAADAGDAVALAIVEEAAAAWADLVLAASEPASRRAGDRTQVCVVGGLAGSTLLVDRWRALLPPHCAVVPARGTALDGALLLAGRHDLPHESRVLRLAPAGARAGGPDAGGARTGAAAPPDVDVDLLATEQVRRDLDDLDQRPPGAVVAELLAAEASVPGAVAAAADRLAEAVTLATAALDAGGRIVYVGAGTPGRLAALDAAECPPTFGTSPDQVVAVLAGGGAASARAVEGAEDDADAGARDVGALGLASHDLVVGISASGRTPYVLAALATASAAGCRTVAIVNNPGSPAAAAADVPVELLTGPEVLSGSTRLKSGTAQKVALNVLSTGAMVGHGKTYGAWMVDVTASNEKLRRRARRILREATGVGDEDAADVLERSGWRAKTALVAILAGVEVDRAEQLLEAAGGRTRAALAAAGGGDPA